MTKEIRNPNDEQKAAAAAAPGHSEFVTPSSSVIRHSPFTIAASPEVLRSSGAQIGISILAGLREIWAHKFRSLLTMLGIILGVSSLVAMSALVSGMEKGAKEALVAIGGLEKIRGEPQDIPIEQRYLTAQAV